VRITYNIHRKKYIWKTPFERPQRRRVEINPSIGIDLSVSTKGLLREEY